MDSDDLKLRQFFAAFSDESRLKIAAAIIDEPRTVTELAAHFSMKEAAVARHLGMFETLGLTTIQAVDGMTLHQLDIDALRALRKTILTRSDAPLPSGSDDIPQSDLVILARFLDRERLKEIPTDRSKRTIVLNWLANQFEHEQRYPEREVNDIIKRHHPDTAALRRYLVDQRLMQRENGVYWRIPE